MDVPPLLSDIAVSTPTIGQWCELALSALLLVVSAFVSASEVAFFSLSPADIDAIDEGRNPADAKLQRLRADSERLLATVLITNNLVNVAIIVLLSHFFTSTISFGGSELLEFVANTVVLTFLLLLFGEIIPKVYSAQRTLPFARRMAPVFLNLNALFRPVSSVLMRSKALTTLIVTRRAEALTTDDLEQALQLTDQAEIADESQMLQGIIRFGDETVRAVMTPRVDMVDLDITTPYPEVLQCITEQKHSRIPVYAETEDNIKGVLYTKDLLPHIHKGASFKWQTLIRPPFFVPETKMIDDLLRDFQQQRVHIAIVVDEFGGTSGIVTMEDVLEEIVGEIDDEYDQQRRSFKRLNQHTYLFEGKTQLVEVERILALSDGFFDDVSGDSDTLAGLVLELKGEFPQPHERLRHEHLTIEVVEMDQRRLTKLKVIVGPTHEKQPHQ